MPEDYNPFKTEYERKPSASNWESLYENFSRGRKETQAGYDREAPMMSDMMMSDMQKKEVVEVQDETLLKRN